MEILRRTNYDVSAPNSPKNDPINNLADQFQQTYQYRDKAIPAGGSSSRPRAHKLAGPVTIVKGEKLAMDQ